MVLLCWSCGVLNGSSLVFIKVGGEVFNSEEAKENAMFWLLMVSLGAICSGTQAYCLNLGMKYYNNIDVMPIY